MVHSSGLNRTRSILPPPFHLSPITFLLLPTPKSQGFFSRAVVDLPSPLPHTSAAKVIGKTCCSFIYLLYIYSINLRTGVDLKLNICLVQCTVLGSTITSAFTHFSNFQTAVRLRCTFEYLLLISNEQNGCQWMDLWVIHVCVWTLLEHTWPLRGRNESMKIVPSGGLREIAAPTGIIPKELDSNISNARG